MVSHHFTFSFPPFQVSVGLEAIDSKPSTKINMDGHAGQRTSDPPCAAADSSSTLEYVSTADDSRPSAGFADPRTPSLNMSTTESSCAKIPSAQTASLPRQSSSQCHSPESMEASQFARLHKFSTLTTVSFVSASVTLPICLAFLGFLWSHPQGTQAPQVWLNLVLSDWMLKSITIAAMLIRTVVSVQGA